MSFTEDDEVYIMDKLTPSPRVVANNILRFKAEVGRSPALQDRLAYARAWYAIHHAGQWHFGPSKFVGYESLGADDYLRDSSENDGRRTEAQLQQWFDVVDRDTDLGEELNTALIAFLAEYGKAPSKMARINILSEDRRARLGTEGADRDRAIVDLILAVAKTLSPTGLRELKARL